jgi:hypothetical protein
VALQVAAVLFDVLELPPEWTRVVLAILVLGFPLASIFAWAYEITPEGLKRDADVDRSSTVAQTAARRLNYITIGVVAVGIALFAFDRFGPGGIRAGGYFRSSPAAPASISVMRVPI